MDPEHDARIAEFVLRMHRYRNPGEQVSVSCILNYWTRYRNFTYVIPHEGGEGAARECGYHYFLAKFTLVVCVPAITFDCWTWLLFARNILSSGCKKLNIILIYDNETFNEIHFRLENSVFWGIFPHSSVFHIFQEKNYLNFLPIPIFIIFSVFNYKTLKLRDGYFKFIQPWPTCVTVIFIPELPNEMFQGVRGSDFWLVTDHEIIFLGIFGRDECF